jgi:hypothetical protein
MNYED